MLKILYCGHGWAENIGNAFIDFGINFQLKKCLPDAQIINFSNVSNYIQWRYSKRKPFNYLFKNSTDQNIDSRTLFDPDYYIFGGSLLSTFWLSINATLINFLEETQKKVIVLGGGGGNKYSGEEESVRNILKKLNLHAFISRDRITYDTYKDLAKFAYDGIDNAFFLNDCFQPAKINKEFIACTFDFTREPKNLFDENEEIIRLYHSYSKIGRFEHLLMNTKKILGIAQQRQIISDYPDDYLHIYGNSTKTFSDQVHACVATLTFGGEARYFDKSDRSYLFERVNLEGIRHKLVKLDNNLILKEKENQITFLKSVF